VGATPRYVVGKPSKQVMPFTKPAQCSDDLSPQSVLLWIRKVGFVRVLTHEG
jgi:hypothetical protein